MTSIPDADVDSNICSAAATLQIEIATCLSSARVLPFLLLIGLLALFGTIKQKTLGSGSKLKGGFYGVAA